MSEPQNEIDAAGGRSDSTAELEVLAEPVAWMTYDIHGAQMVWTDYKEACVYCDDDEQPIPLYMLSNAELRGAKPIGEASLSNDVLGTGGRDGTGN